MADEPKSTPVKSEPSPAAPSPSAAATAPAVQNGKGDAPRNCFSDSYRSNFESIDWSK